MIVSIDLGISTTKIVHRDGKSTLKTELIEERLDLPRLVDYVSHLETVSAIAVTGVGSQYIGSTLCGKPVVHVDEFEANTLSARNYVSAERLLLESMGTGTSFILVDGDQFSHLGGSALGGGTLQGMM